MSSCEEKFHPASRSYKLCLESNSFRDLHGIRRIEGLSDAPLPTPKPQSQPVSAVRPTVTVGQANVARRGCCGGGQTIQATPASPATTRTALKPIPKRRQAQPHVKPAERPGLFDRVQSLAMATLRHRADDNAETPPDVVPFRGSLCSTCPQNVGDECQLCGCLLKPNAINSGKILWRSEQCPAGRWFRHNANRVPFTREPTRHLIYHIFPRRSPKIGSRVWQWNADQLARRIDQFNGKRIVAIAVGDNSDKPEVVTAYFRAAGIDAKFVVYPNEVKRQEMVSFIDQLAAVESLNPDEIVFRGHAKGVKHDNFFDGSGRRPWVEAIYATALDDLPAINDALESHVTAGAFRFHKAFNRGKTWCYCGSMYWFRAKDIYSRNWNCATTDKFWGVEEWPGRLAKVEESACLLHDFATTFTALADLKKWDSQGIWKELDTWLDLRGLPRIERA